MRQTYDARMRRTWDRTRVIAVLVELRDNGITVQQMSKMAGVTRATIYRWIGGEVTPDWIPVRTLAWAIWPRYPNQARELVEASGWPWQEPPEPEPEPLVDPEVAEILRRRYPDEADELIAELERRRAARLSERSGGQEAS
jgi:AcrR family transcriptional regulator